MTIALGIDTGGTYTDAVLVDQADNMVLAGAKALTTYRDLSIGIGRAVAAVLEKAASLPGRRAICPSDINLVGLSTTLATNAIVEGRGSPVCLLLIGYDPAVIKQYGFERALVTENVVYLRGGHDGAGNEIEPLDEEAARAAILAWRDRVEAFAVSGYFGVRNPEHELRVKALVEELTASASGPEGLAFPVTCGHELTSRLDAIRRATTAALNARLIPLLRQLISTVRHTLEALGITAPLMVVKGDGSLVRAEWAIRRPIETILSGPAASVVGAWHLSGRRDVWVVDVGGTTTDIAMLRGGLPALNVEGARVGQWRTMVQAIDVHTVGLGGDSQVTLDGVSSNGRHGLVIGPRRVVPLCLLAADHPEIVSELRRQVALRRQRGLAGQFVLSQRQPSGDLSSLDRELLSRLDGTPQSLITLVEQVGYGWLAVRQLEELEAKQLIVRSSFTPTDALHVLGRFREWDAEASRLGAELFAAQLGTSPETFCEWVVAEVSNRVTQELVSKVLGDEVVLPDWQREPSAAALLARAVDRAPESALGCQLTLRHPVVAVGAPVEAYLPRTAEQLHTELIIPPHAEVANAVGAVVGGVVQRMQALIRPVEVEQSFRLYLPDGIRDFANVEAAVAYAHQVIPERLREMARRAGAEQVEIQTSRVDRIAPVTIDWGQEIYVETELTFTAVGRPSLAQ